MSFFFPDSPCFFQREESHTLDVLAALEQASQEELDGRVLELHKSGSPRKKRWLLCSTLSIKLTSVHEPQACLAGAHFSSLIGCRHGSEPALGACLIPTAPTNLSVNLLWSEAVVKPAPVVQREQGRNGGPPANTSSLGGRQRRRGKRADTPQLSVSKTTCLDVC